MGNLGSLLVVLISGIAAYRIRFDRWDVDNPYLVSLLLGLLLCSVVLPATGAYRREFRWDPFRKTRRLLAGWALVVTSMVVLAALLKVSADYSRIWFGSWVVITALGLGCIAFVEYTWLVRQARKGRYQRQIVLVGNGPAAQRIEAKIAQDPAMQLIIIDRFGQDWGGEATRPLDTLEAYIAEHRPAEVWIAAENNQPGFLESALRALRNATADVHVVPDLHQYRFLNQKVDEWQGMPVITLSGTPMTGAERRVKFAFDWIAAATLTIGLLPLIVLIALLIRLSSGGPALFRQLRHGIGGEPIAIYKFRTMIVHKEPQGRLTQATPEDARVTRIGRWLRRTSLDELPQLFNVLRGEMSLVGPRPHPVELNEAYLRRIPRYMLRHKVKPGITGWAQVNGFRGITDSDQKMQLRIEHDLWYIQNWSLWLDIQILLRTPFAMVGRNAF